MSLPLHPEHLRATYDYLRAFRPFSHWRLPPGETVAFHVTRDKGRYGWFLAEAGEYSIGMSASLVGNWLTLVKVMAHEMIHLKQQHHGTAGKSMHNAEFRRLADRVCRDWLWDVKDFYF